MSTEKHYYIDAATGERIGFYKERSGWGQWHTIHAFFCPWCGKVIKLVVNWHGPTPNGGFCCAYCNHVVSFSGSK